MIVDIQFEDPRWETAELQHLADTAFVATLTYLDLSTEWEVSLLACDDARISDLNRDFRDKAKPTNVLSWPSEERAAETPGGLPLPPQGPDPELGDIAISYDTCLKESTEAGKPFADHVTHLLVHGLLHLLGYDHIDDQDAALMEGIEVEVLGKLGINNPYIEA